MNGERSPSEGDIFVGRSKLEVDSGFVYYAGTSSWMFSPDGINANFEQSTLNIEHRTKRITKNGPREGDISLRWKFEVGS